MKKYLVTIIFVVAMLLCRFMYSVLGGATILADGTLSEPFYLIGISGFCLLGAVISLIVIIFKSIKSRLKDKIFVDK